VLFVITLTHHAVTQRTKKNRLLSQVALVLSFLATSTAAGLAQSADESLGPKDTGGKTTYLVREMNTLHSALKPELAGVHPRVYFTNAELDTLRAKAHGPQQLWWKQQTAHLRVMQGPPPLPPAEKRRAQNDVALAIAEAAFAYKIDSEPKVLARAKQYMDAALSYDVWGYSWSKPNVDLAAGHLLYAMGIAYDLLYNDLSPEDRTRYRAAIAHHGHILYEYFAPKPGRVWSYSQNHTFIPIAGLAVAAYAVYGEVPEAAQWAALSRAIFDRVLATYSKDGYYFEGFEYWIFATPWIVHYLDAHQHATGEDLFNQPGLKQTHLYVAHSVTPDGQMMFDLGDVFEGSITRSKKGEDYERSHPNGHFETNYNVLYDLAARFHDPQIQGVADHLRHIGQTNQEEWWTLAWRNSAIKSAPIDTIPTSHWFKDHDVAFWRSSWHSDATAVAYKCGPAEGHAAAALRQQLPDWRFEQGHVHPDVNSFILWAKGSYLTGDAGYAGVPKTIDHNSLLIDNAGQGTNGVGHDAWARFDYDRLNTVRIVRAQFTSDGFVLTGEGTGAYNPSLGLTQFQRTLTLHAGTLDVTDSIAATGNHTYTETLHADANIRQLSPSTFTLHPVIGAITLSARIASPAGVITKIQPNVVMGPGIPGSVDKGSLEQRGELITATTTEPAPTAQFHWVLKF
jgi:hypothetical protein